MHLAIFLALISTAGLLQDDAPASPGPSGFTKSGHTVDSLELVKERIRAKQAVLIDVREIYEWKDGHLQDATLVPLSAVRKDALTSEMKKSLPKDKPIYCHCMSGQRVLMASKLLREQGYDIRPLQLGYDKLLDAGFKQASDKE